MELVRAVGVHLAIGHVVNHHGVIHVSVNNRDYRGTRCVLRDRLTQGHQNRHGVLVGHTGCLHKVDHNQAEHQHE